MIIVKIAEFFCGIGANRIAFERVFGDKAEFVFAFDMDEDNIRCYESNFGEGSVSRKMFDAPDHDLAIINMPFDGSIHFGKTEEEIQAKRKPHGYEATFEMLQEKQPAMILISISSNIGMPKNKKAYDDFLASLRKVGYRTFYRKVQYPDYGVPNDYDKMFFFGFRSKFAPRKMFEFTPPKLPTPCIGEFLEKEPVDESFYLTETQLRKLKKRTASSALRDIDANTFRVVEHDEMLHRFNGGPRSIMGNLIRDTRVFGKNRHNVRNLTPSEMLRMYGFPEDYKTLTEFVPERQVRNCALSIPVPVMEHIAKLIEKRIDGLTLDSDVNG